MNTAELAATAHAMVSKNRGILAADESTSTILKRFNTIKLDSTEETRRTYREMLFTTPGASEYISGVILLRRDDPPEDQGRRAVSGLSEPAQHDARHQGRHRREASRGLSRRDHHRGARRAARAAGRVLQAGRAIREVARGDRYRRGHSDGATPSTPMRKALARYAALCQEAGIVPIVEPEVLMDGDHPIERCEEVTNAVLQTRVRSSVRRAHRARGHGAQAEHGGRRARRAPRRPPPSKLRRPRCAR